MLRVAGLGWMVVNAWTGPKLDKDSIIQTLLFHDIAKPVTFDLSKQAEFGLSSDRLEKLKQDTNYLVHHYGSDEHQVALKIFQEIGLSPESQRLIENLEWHYTDDLIKKNDLSALITIYSDMRIGPQGLLLIKQRVLELHSRMPIQNLTERLDSADRLEAIIAQNTDIDLTKISAQSIEVLAKQFEQKQVG